MNNPIRSSLVLFGLLVSSMAWFAVAPDAGAAERRVAITADTKAIECDGHPMSQDAHGPTTKFYVLPDSTAVVEVATVDGTADAAATIHLFTTAEGIEKWIEQHFTDLIDPDTPNPLRSIPVPADRFHARVGPPLDHEVGEFGDEYDRVRVEFTIDAFEDGDLAVEAWQGGLDAFVRTKGRTMGVDVREPR